MGNDSSCNVIGSRRGSSCNKKKKRNKIRDKLTKKAQIHLCTDPQKLDLKI